MPKRLIFFCENKTDKIVNELQIPIIQERALKIILMCSQAYPYVDMAQITIITNVLLHTIKK